MDRFSGKRCDLPIEIIATHLETPVVHVSPLIAVTVYRITGEHDLLPASEVTATDILRLLEGKEVTQPQADESTRKSLTGITRKPKETMAVG